MHSPRVSQGVRFIDGRRRPVEGEASWEGKELSRGVRECWTLSSGPSALRPVCPWCAEMGDGEFPRCAEDCKARKEPYVDGS